MPRHCLAPWHRRINAPEYRDSRRWVGASNLLLLLLVGCHPEQSTQPRTTIDVPLTPRYVLSDIPPTIACVPEVITTSTDSTETALTTFENSCDASHWLVDLRQWGMEFVDWYRNDPMQGDLQWQFRNTADFQNMPSPPTILYNYDQVYGYGVVEFKPPVRKVEFHYSALKQTRAVWNGQLVEHSDSFRVRALDSLGQQVVARTLYSNVASTTPPWNVWTPVALETPTGDNISWLRIDGAAQLDNVKITRAPLRCTTVVRADVVSCEAITGGTVLRWTYTSDDSLPARSADSVAVWRGRLVAPGTVSATIAAGTGQKTYRTRVAPQPRSWAYSWQSRWGLFTQYPLVGYDGEPNSQVNGSNFHGANCPLYQGAGWCTSKYWYQPHPDEFADSIAFAVVTDSGPNRGFWYVTRVPYTMYRVGAMTEGAKPASPQRHYVSNASASCKKALGVGSKDSAFANWYQFNESCGSSPKVNIAELTGSILGHEGRGYDGGRGHQGLAEAAAKSTENDPYATLEAYVGVDSIALLGNAQRAVVGMDARVKEATKESNVYGNWSGKVWYWDPLTSRWSADLTVSW